MSAAVFICRILGGTLATFSLHRIQYAEEVGVVLIYSCAHHPDGEVLRLKNMNESKSCTRLKGH